MKTILLAAVVILVALSGASAKELYIPVAGISPGANGTFWRTDLRVYNPSGADTIELTLSFIAAGTDGRDAAGRVFAVGPRQMLVLNNVVATLAPDLTQALGAIRISSGREFAATSRTYTPSADPRSSGTYGQFVPAMDAAAARRTTVILHVSYRPEFRTNFGVMNPGDGSVTVKATIFGFDGVPLLQSDELTIPPVSIRQWSALELFGGLFMTDGYVRIEASEPVFTWGAIVDNDSGDSMFVPGTEALTQPGS